MSSRWNNEIIYHKDLEKQEDQGDCFVLGTVTSLWNVAQWVSGAPPHHTLPVFLSLNSRLKFGNNPTNFGSKSSFHRTWNWNIFVYAIIDDWWIASKMSFENFQLKYYSDFLFESRFFMMRLHDLYVFLS